MKGIRRRAAIITRLRRTDADAGIEYANRFLPGDEIQQNGRRGLLILGKLAMEQGDTPALR
jgi:hypothetical protein